MEISIEHYNNMAERLTELEYELSESVKVVRCKDCKHRDERCGMGEHRWCRILKMSTVLNDFCSYGERKGGDDE